MAPHTLDTILRQPTWPASLCHFVTWCLMWDPKTRPTSTQALQHEYFRDAVDPLRPKSSSRLLGRKQSGLSVQESRKETLEAPTLNTKSSNWFRRSLIAREISAPAVTQHAPQVVPTNYNTVVPIQTRPDPSNTLKVRPNANKRATWTHGTTNAAPIPILSSAKPASPVAEIINARAVQQPKIAAPSVVKNPSIAKKVPPQLTLHQQQQELHRLEAEKALNGQGAAAPITNGQTSGLTSPTSSHRESFFAHLRKRARRFSGRYHTPMSPTEDMRSEASSQYSTQATSNFLGALPVIPNDSGSFADLDKALQSVQHGLDAQKSAVVPSHTAPIVAGNSMLKRHHSTSSKELPSPSIRQVLATHKSQSNLNYDTPDEEDEILHDSLMRHAAKNINTQVTPSWKTNSNLLPSPSTQESKYLTPATSANRNSIHYGHTDYNSQPKMMEINKIRQTQETDRWPTPPYENEWANSTAASIYAATSGWR
jgi:meiosis induction protein kinase IME2/SME1